MDSLLEHSIDSEDSWDDGIGRRRSSPDESLKLIPHLSERDDEEKSTSSEHPSRGRRGCCSPVMILIFLSLTNIFNYYDRGAIAAVLTSIQEIYGLSDAEGGILGSAFMVGFMIFSPIFVGMTYCLRSSVVMFIGLLVWSAAAIISTTVPTYWSLLLARLFVGVGEASFSGIAPTYIDDFAPKSSRTRWLAVFYSAIPVGAALGYLAGAVIGESNWKAPFLLEGAVMIPLAFLCLLLPPLEVTSQVDEKNLLPVSKTEKGVERESLLTFDARRAPSDSISYQNPMSSGMDKAVPYGNDSTDVDTQTFQPLPSFVGTEFDVLGQTGKGRPAEQYDFCEALLVLLRNRLYMLAVFGYSAYTFTIGALAFWGPAYLQDQLGLSKSSSNYVFSIVAVVTGFGGTAIGGIVVDRQGGAVGLRGAKTCVFWSLIFVLVSIPLCLIALSWKDLYFFIPGIFLGETALFCVTAPINAALLRSVPLPLRSHAMALSIFIIHAFGDLPSPIITGLINDSAGSIQVGLFFLILWLIFAVILWLIGFLYARYLVQSQELDDDIPTEGQDDEDILKTKQNQHEILSFYEIPSERT